MTVGVDGNGAHKTAVNYASLRDAPARSAPQMPTLGLFCQHSRGCRNGFGRPERHRC